MDINIPLLLQSRHGKTEESAFLILETMLKLMGEAIVKAFPWVKDMKTIQHPTVNLRNHVLSLHAKVGKGLEILLEGHCSDKSLLLMKPMKPEEILTHLELYLLNPNQSLVDEILDPKEPTDLLGALAYARGVFDRTPTPPTGTRTPFPFGEYLVNHAFTFVYEDGMEVREPLLKVDAGTLRVISSSPEESVVMVRTVQSLVPTSDLWGAYNNHWITPREIPTGSMTVVQSVTFHTRKDVPVNHPQTDLGILWFPIGTVIEVQPPDQILHPEGHWVSVNLNELEQAICSGALQFTP